MRYIFLAIMWPLAFAVASLMWTWTLIWTFSPQRALWVFDLFRPTTARLWFRTYYNNEK